MFPDLVQFLVRLYYVSFGRADSSIRGTLIVHFQDDLWSLNTKSRGGKHFESDSFVGFPIMLLGYFAILRARIS